MLTDHRFGDAGKTIVVEEQVAGSEASIHAICDGTRYFLLPAVQDHNASAKEIAGPTPAAWVPTGRRRSSRASSSSGLGPLPSSRCCAGLAQRGTPFTGVLFAGLIVARGRAHGVEYNVRFGDPETEVLMDLVEGDFAEALAAAASSQLDPATLVRTERHSIAVVLAAEGYPDKPRLGDVIEGLDEAARIPGVAVYHAGTRREEGRVVTAGGRVLVVTATGDTLRQARDTAYEGVGAIHFRGMQFRRDIGSRALS